MATKRKTGGSRRSAATAAPSGARSDAARRADSPDAHAQPAPARMHRTLVLIALSQVN